MCRHLSLLLSQPSQQQLTNCRERGTILSQSRAATYQLSQPIRGRHSLPRGIKGPLCWGFPMLGEMMVFCKSLLPLRSWGVCRLEGGSSSYLVPDATQGLLGESNMLQGSFTWMMS